MFTVFTQVLGLKLKIVTYWLPILVIFICRKYFTEREAALIVRDVASALEFLHSKGQYHICFSYQFVDFFFALRVQRLLQMKKI
jgi:hypothetical protein